MTKKPVVTGNTFFTFITFSNMNSLQVPFKSLNSIYNTYLLKTKLPQLQKDCHQDNLSFTSLQLYKHDCLNIISGNICFHKQIINQ